MLQEIKVPDLNCWESNFYLKPHMVDVEMIDTCPVCNKRISPVFIYGELVNCAKSLKTKDVVDNSLVHTIYRCPDCQNAILISYIPKYIKKQNLNYSKTVYYVWDTFKVKSIAPTPIAQFPYKEIICQISSKFKDIYLQSLQAKLDGKNELVGIGYRKSIEFLVKDYLIYIKHEKSEEIPKMHLGDCLKLIENRKIQNLAKASTWLGNDETHYVRKHTDKDISDLEKFLDALVYFITFEITADEAESFTTK